MRKLIAMAIALVMIISILCAPSVSAAYSTSVPAAGQVATQRDPLNIHIQAGMSYRVVAQAPKGSYLQIIGESGAFYKVVYNTSGSTGYVAKQYLKIVSTGTGTIATLRDPLVLRGSPSTSGSNLAQIPKGKVVPLLGKSSDGKWLKVVYGNKIGWCAASYISVAGSTASTGNSTGIPSANIFVYQGSGTSYCTAASAAMLVRADLALQGKSYSGITLNSVLSSGWSSGLKWDFWVGNAHLKSYSLTGTATEKKKKITSLLASHPEGIVLYGWTDRSQHAVYMASNQKILDPFYNSKQYRNLSESASSASDNWGTINRYWIIVN